MSRLTLVPLTIWFSVGLYGPALAQTTAPAGAAASPVAPAPASAASSASAPSGATAPSFTDLQAQATQLLERGEYARARPLAEQAVRGAEQADGAQSLPVASALVTLGIAQTRLGQHPQALATRERVLALNLQLLPPDHVEISRSLRRVAASQVLMARFEPAMANLQRALPIEEKASGADHPEYALTLNEIAQIHNRTGRPAEAMPLAQRALGILERSLGPDNLQTAGGRMSLATYQLALARYDEALPQMEQALATYERQLGPEHPTTGRSLNNLASVYQRLGQHAKALPLRQRALAIAERTVGPEHEETALNLNNLAQTHAALGQHDQAVALQERTVAIREKVHGPEHPRTALAVNNLSRNLFAAGRLEQALPLQQRALAIREKVLGALHPDTASSWVNLATLEQALGRSEPALAHAQRGYAAYAAVLGPNHPSTATAVSALAQIHLALGDRPLAIALMKQAVNVQQQMREQAARIDSEALQSYTESVATFYQQLAAALSDAGRLPEAQLVLDMLKEDEQFEFVRRTAAAGTVRTRIGYNALEQGWGQRYAQISDRLAALGAEKQALDRQASRPGGLNPEQRSRRDALNADLAVAQRAFETFLAEMRADFAAQGAARSAELAESGTRALAELRELLRSLGPGSALLQIYLTDERVNLLLTTPGVQLARTVTVPAREVNRQVAQFRRLLRDPKSDPLPAAQALYRLLVAPVAQDLEQAGAATVMLWLDGALRYVPFAALHDGNRFLVERWRLPLFTGVTRDRLREPVRPAWRAAGLGVTRRIGEFDALPGVRTEMNGIIRGPAGAAGPMPGEIYLDEAFTAPRLEDVSRRGFEVMHVASHFRFSPGTEADSFLLLGDGQQLTLAELRRRNVRFDEVDLLTLSACETGLGGGRDERGREIEGFGVVAQQQGARAVLATLWSVADQSTARLMAETYRLRETQSLPKIEALQRAQRALAAQERTRHPFYWAPFILMGNWR